MTDWRLAIAVVVLPKSWQGPIQSGHRNLGAPFGTISHRPQAATIGTGAPLQRQHGSAEARGPPWMVRLRQSRVGGRRCSSSISTCRRRPLFTRSTGPRPVSAHVLPQRVSTVGLRESVVSATGQRAAHRWSTGSVLRAPCETCGTRRPAETPASHAVWPVRFSASAMAMMAFA
jgi:hypothetical protein